MNEKFRQIFEKEAPVAGDTLPDEEFLRKKPGARGQGTDPGLGVRARRCLIGLTVLVLTALLVAPMVFEPDDRYTVEGAKTEIPRLADRQGGVNLQFAKAPEVVRPKSADGPSQSPRTQVPSTPVAPAEESGKSAVAQPQAVTEVPVRTVVAGAPQVKAPATKTEPKKPETRPAEQVSKPAEKKAEPVKAAQPQAVANGRFYIQISAYAKKDAALAQRKRILALGLPAYVEQYKQLWRLRVGRFATREDAQAALNVLALNVIGNGGIVQESATLNKGR